MMREHHRPQSDASQAGPSLLKEQMQLLSEAPPADINSLYFLKVRLSSQQRATAQRNYWLRAQQSGDGASRSGSAAAPSAAQAMPIVDTEAYPSLSSHPNTRSSSGAPAAAAASADRRPHSRSPLAESSGFSASASAASAPPQPSFDDMPASAARRAMLGDNGTTAGAAGSGGFGSPYRSAEAPANPLDEVPAMASGTPQVPEDAEYRKDVHLVPCPHCGRTFAPERLERHATTCERQQVTHPKPKPEGKDRKAPSSSASTTASVRGRSERATTAASTAAGSSGPPSAATAAPGGAVRSEKWRRQSAQLRSAMAGASGAEDDRVQCPSCRRRFSHDAAERHIPICKGK